MEELKINSRLRVRRNVVVYLKRKIIGGSQSRIAVKVGQEVHSEDILGEGQVITGFRSIHLSTELNTSPKEALKFLKRNIGQKIFQGEILAIKDGVLGLNKKTIFSPSDGILEYYDEGRGDLRIRLTPKSTRLASGVYGIVDNIEPDKGVVVIKSLVDIIYGVLGVGNERDGILHVLGTAENLTSSRQIQPTMKGYILVGGGLVFLDALEKAVSYQVAGFISGGMNAGDYKSMTGGKWNYLNQKWTDVGISLLITEGFGSIPLGPDIYPLLQKYDGRFIMIEGHKHKLILPSNDRNSIIYIRKTELPKISYIDSEPGEILTKLKVGLWVRITQDPLVGTQGVVESIDQTPTLLPSGIKTYMVTLNCKSRKLNIPYTNIETIYS